MKKRRPPRPGVILLRDLAPQREVKGGAGKRVFGERVEAAPSRPLGKKKGKRPR